MYGICTYIWLIYLANVSLLILLYLHMSYTQNQIPKLFGEQ